VHQRGRMRMRRTEVMGIFALDRKIVQPGRP
jgi:hypothetical protein